MKATDKKLDNALKGLVQNLSVLGVELPKKLHQAAKDIEASGDKEGAKMIKKAMKDSNITNLVAELVKTKKGFPNFIKKY